MPHASARRSIVTQLVANGAAKARDIAIAASNEFGVPLFDLDAINLDLEAVRLVTDKLLAKHRVLPLFRRGKRLFLAVADPTNLHAIDEIKFQTSLGIEAIVVEDDKLQKAIDKAIEQVDNQMPALNDEEAWISTRSRSPAVKTRLDDKVSRDDVEDAPIVRFVNKVMLDAIRRGASDIHFEPYEKIYRVRLRMDGVLKEIAQPPVQLAQKLSARLKVMSRLDIAERRVPQDGRIKMRLSKNRAIDFRVSTCPTLFGEKIVMRILDPSQAQLGIDALGYEPFQKDLYLKYLAKPQGMILVTGPTGSGKTVSLYTGLHILNREDTNISTAEDPAEINLPGVNQVNVNPKVGLTFACRHARVPAPGPGCHHGRRDPRPGDGRDRHQGRPDRPPGALHPAHQRCAADTDAPDRHGREALRHRDLGQPHHCAAPGARLCTHCKQPMDIPKEALLKEGFHENEVAQGLKIFVPKGCSNCTDGYKGRVGIYQVMPVTESIARIILAGGAPWTSPSRPPRKASGICAARDWRRSRTA